MNNNTPKPGNWSAALRRLAALITKPKTPSFDWQNHAHTQNPAAHQRYLAPVPQGFWIRGPNREADSLDYFAGCALSGHIAKGVGYFGVTPGVAEDCYDEAELMLAESRKRRAARNPSTPESAA